jgi:hypothetical protein
MEKQPIDKIRNSGGSIEIGSIEDGAIIQMKEINGRLFVIKEKSIYEIIMADVVDPERTNIKLPPMSQKLIIDKGSDSEVVSKILLTAINLFSSDHILDSIDCDIALSLVVDLLSEIVILEKEIVSYQEEEKNLINEYEEQRNRKDSYKIPSVINLESRCKTIFQKADHVEQIIMDITVQFYPNKGLTKQSHFPKLYEVLKLEYGENDLFVNFIEKALYFMRVVREFRNGFDHRLNIAKVINFELQIDGNIIRPTIELNHKDIKMNRTSLSEFLSLVLLNNLEIAEIMFVYLASKNLSKKGIPCEIRLIPEDKKRNKFIKYGYWSPLFGGFFI